MIYIDDVVKRVYEAIRWEKGYSLRFTSADDLMGFLTTASGETLCKTFRLRDMHNIMWALRRGVQVLPARNNKKTVAEAIIAGAQTLTQLRAFAPPDGSITAAVAAWRAAVARNTSAAFPSTNAPADVAAPAFAALPPHGALGVAPPTAKRQAAPPDGRRVRVKREKGGADDRPLVLSHEVPAVQLLMQMQFSERDAVRGLRAIGFSPGDDPETAADVAMTHLVKQIEDLDEARASDSVALVAEGERERQSARRRHHEGALRRLEGPPLRDTFKKSVLLSTSSTAPPHLPRLREEDVRRFGALARIEAAAARGQHEAGKGLGKALVELLLLEDKCYKWFKDEAAGYFLLLGERLAAMGGDGPLWSDTAAMEALREAMAKETKALNEAIYLDIGGMTPKIFRDTTLDSVANAKATTLDSDGVEFLRLSEGGAGAGDGEREVLDVCDEPQGAAEAEEGARKAEEGEGGPEDAEEAEKGAGKAAEGEKEKAREGAKDGRARAGDRGGVKMAAGEATDGAKAGEMGPAAGPKEEGSAAAAAAAAEGSAGKGMPEGVEIIEILD